MITKININNFKAIKSLMLVPTSLNLFMGLNGMGEINSYPIIVAPSSKFEVRFETVES